MAKKVKPDETPVEPSWVNPWAAPFAAWTEFVTDATQRNILFLDVMRQRGNQYVELTEKPAPHALQFEFEPIVLGWKLARPVNYVLVSIHPPADVMIDPQKRPFVVVDPRAGHGPGIGGFKADSEIGVAMRAGHPCYFIGFLPEPVAGQTIEDIMAAQAVFLETVIARHPEADGKPCVIGNCQAGWAVLMLAAARPELFGPIIAAGSPLSYWAGVRGQNPMRYTGGLLGGSWLAAMTSDLGNGKFDGAWLVGNFEKLNPANTLWSKQYNLWSKVDTEASRYLGFENWWGNHVNLNAEEIQFIVDELFVGNKLATAEIVTSDGHRLDLRSIKSPIVCFCSKGDNITPPQQALGWILDLYANERDIAVHGQTIVYAIHESVGHLGIFVSGGVAKKEHQEFASNIDLIDCLPPGLYEAVMTPKNADTANVDLVAGEWVVRFERRTIDDIRQLGGNNLEDEREFAAVRRISETNLGLYRTFVQPWVRAISNEKTAELLARMHPARMQFEMFSDRNPLMRGIADMAEQVRAQRAPAKPDNPLVQLQEQISSQIESSLDSWRELRDGTDEKLFHAMYGSPLVQALAGLRASDGPPRRRPGDEPEHLEFVERELARLRQGIDVGGVREAAIRAIAYVGIPVGRADERTFAMLKQIRAERGGSMSVAEFKALLRDQMFMLRIDEEAAVRAIPAMLPADPKARADAMQAVRRVALAAGEPNEEQQQRLARIEALFGAAEEQVETDPAKAGRPRIVRATG